VLAGAGIGAAEPAGLGRRERNAARRAEGNRVGKDPVMGGLARMAAEEAVTRTGQGLRIRPRHGLTLAERTGEACDQ